MTATKLVAAAVVVLASLLVGTPAAMAHEVAVAVVVPVGVGSSEADVNAVVDGLRLAIDESPDVGHAPGPDAGDHLGGVDVELIELGRRSADDASAAVLEAVSAGATFVVLVGEAEAVATVAGVVPNASAMSVVVLTDGDGSGVSIQGAVLRPSPNFDADTDATLSGAFEMAYGRKLSDSAAVGYDVGQFLDVLIAETNGALPDAAALDRASAKAQARLSFTTIESVGRPRATTAESPSPTSGNRDRFSIGSTALLGLGAAAVGTVAIWLGRRRRSPPG